MLSGGTVTPSDTVKITLVDNITNEVITTANFPVHSDIRDWLDTQVDYPEHAGYHIDHLEITSGSLDNLTEDATIYVIYVKSDGGNRVYTFINGDGDIVVNIQQTEAELSGSAKVEITTSKNFSDVSYESYDIVEFTETETQTKADIAIVGNVVSFTDDDISTHNLYRIGLFDSNSGRVGQVAWDAGFYPTKIKFSISDATYYEYNIVKNQ